MVSKFPRGGVNIPEKGWTTFKNLIFSGSPMKRQIYPIHRADWTQTRSWRRRSPHYRSRSGDQRWCYPPSHDWTWAAARICWFFRGQMVHEFMAKSMVDGERTKNCLLRCGSMVLFEAAIWQPHHSGPIFGKQKWWRQVALNNPLVSWYRA